MIYVITDGNKNAKIGVAKNPIRRLSNLQISHPGTLVLLAVADWPDVAEKRIHYILRRDRLRGEWFRMNPDVYKLIKHMHSGRTYEEWLRSMSGAIPSRLAHIIPLRAA